MPPNKSFLPSEFGVLKVEQKNAVWCFTFKFRSRDRDILGSCLDFLARVPRLSLNSNALYIFNAKRDLGVGEREKDVNSRSKKLARFVFKLGKVLKEKRLVLRERGC